MGQLNFFGSSDDSIDILQGLIQTRRFFFVVDMLYTEPRPIIFRDLDDRIKQLLAIRNSVFIWSETHSLFPPFFSVYKDGSMDIRLNHCGPGFDLSLVKTSVSKGKFQLGYGWLFIPPIFYHPSSGEVYKVSNDIRNDFDDVRNIIKRRLEKRYFIARRKTAQGNISTVIDTVWIGKNSISLLEEGEASIFIYGEWLSGANLKKKKEDVHYSINLY